jgi:hypothetical protein
LIKREVGHLLDSSRQAKRDSSQTSSVDVRSHLFSFDCRRIHDA